MLWRRELGWCGNKSIFWPVKNCPNNWLLTVFLLDELAIYQKPVFFVPNYFLHDFRDINSIKFTVTFDKLIFDKFIL